MGSSSATPGFLIVADLVGKIVVTAESFRPISSFAISADLMQRGEDVWSTTNGRIACRSIENHAIFHVTRK